MLKYFFRIYIIRVKKVLIYNKTETERINQEYEYK